MSQSGYAELWAAVDMALYETWDPIGIRGEPAARDEYQAYVHPVVEALLAGARADEIAKLLNELARDRMGLQQVDSMPAALRIFQSYKKQGENEMSNPLTLLREEVCRTNKMLPECGLVTMHSGNASGYLPEQDVLVIKPSGMDYDKITPECLVPVRVSTGEVLEAGFKPSVDLAHHLFLYRNLPGVRGVIHTHSNFATAFAAVLKPVPLVLTAIADEFGDEIPCAPYVDNEGEHIGEAILKYRNRSPAILMGNHGVFAWGETPTKALKAAVMTEDVAKTVWLSMQLGTPQALPPEEAEKWYDRYHNRYGQ